MRAAPQQRVSKLRAPFEQVFGVVQHQQHAPGFEPLRGGFREVLARLLLDGQGAATDFTSSVGSRQGSQLDERTTIREVTQHLAGHLQPQPGLAAATGTCEGQQRLEVNSVLSCSMSFSRPMKLVS